MDPISLDSIVFTEDKKSDGFDLSLVDPPEEFKSDNIFNDGGDGLGIVQTESVSEDTDNHENSIVEGFRIKPEGVFSNVSDGNGDVSIDNVNEINSKILKVEGLETVNLNFGDSDNIVVNETSNGILNDTNKEQLNDDLKLEAHANNGSPQEIGNDDIQITLDDGGLTGKKHIDLFGAFKEDTLENSKENNVPVNLFAPIEDNFVEDTENIEGNDMRIEKREENVFIGEIPTPKLAEPDLIESTRKKIQPGEDLVRINSEPDDSTIHKAEDFGDDTSFPDMAIQRLRKDSSSGSEFEFELPQVKKKTQDSNLENDSAQPSKPEPTTEQKTVLQDSAEQKSVSIETSQETVKDGNMANITTTTKKIIQYEPSEEPIQERSPSGATSEWDNVQTIEAGFVKEGETVKPSLPESTPVLSFFEMQDQLIKTDHSSLRAQIHTSVDRRGFSALKHFIFGPPKMNRNLHASREKVFCIAASHFDNAEKMHTRALQTIYKCLTGSRFDCRRFGSHWEEIGFQGNDPSTDLRGGGLLGLMNLIYLLRDPKCHIMAKEIYKLSLHPTQNFPFCLMGINMSRITLQSLREDCLNKECNRRQDVLGVVNDFYAGIYLQMYQLWKSKGKTISDSGFVIKYIETEAKKNPHHVFKNLEEYLRSKKSTGGVNLDNMDLGGDNFLSVCETEAGQY